RVFGKDGEGRAPKPPDPPVPPRTPMQKLFENLHAGMRTPIPHLATGLLSRPLALPVATNVSSLQITKSNSYDVHVHVRRLKHGNTLDLPAVYIEYESEYAPSFTIDYELQPANLPAPVKRQLHV